jgi:hypothetical protein
MSTGVAVPPAPARARRRRRVPWSGSATPDRLRRVGAVVVVGCLIAAVVSLVSGLTRVDAVAEGGGRVAALTAGAAELYRTLADADASATTGYVSGGVEPAAVRARYDDDIARASAGLVDAAGRIPAGDPAAAAVATIAAQLPVYTGLIETARTYNRQGRPLGQSYLTSASTLMRTTILPAAVELRRIETAALARDYASGGGFPLTLLLFGIAVLAGLADLSFREYRRTHRVLSPGLVAAAGLVLAALVWWVVVTAVAGSALADARLRSDAATALDDARTAVLQARSNESLVLVARGGGAADAQFGDLLDRVVRPGGLLETAEADGADVADVRAAALAWQAAHRELRGRDDSGDYAGAVASAVSDDPDGSNVAFQRLDATLGVAVAAQRAAFTTAIGRAGGAQSMLAAGPAVLLVLAAAAVVVGVSRRIEEYR